jgi:hypothetical protein
MGDIDLLVRPVDLPRVARALSSLGYIEAFVTHRHRVFQSPEKAGAAHPGEHPDNVLKIEVHESVGEPLPVRRVDITGTLAPADRRPGLLPYRDEVELLRHLLLHAAGNMRAHALRQVQLHDIALLTARLSVDAWAKLLATPESEGGCWWMYPPLRLALQYYPGCTNAPLEEFARACPGVLRAAARRDTLTEVSWSNLRIHAFPGICWSRSPVDVLRYARQRVFPDRNAIAELGLAVEAQPSIGQLPWYRLGHGQRILRWVFSRPPRVHTMVSLRGALEEGRRMQ